MICLADLACHIRLLCSRLLCSDSLQKREDAGTSGRQSHSVAHFMLSFTKEVPHSNRVDRLQTLQLFI